MNSFATGILKKGDVYKIQPKLTIALQEPWSSLNPEEQTLLKKIISAIHHPIEAVHIIHEDSLEQQCVNPTKIISFGQKNVAYHTRTTSVKGIPMVYTYSLKELLENETHRNDLWLVLKEVFGLAK